MARILVQDFDLDILSVISFLLIEERHIVLSLTSYHDAIRAAKSFKPDLILLDFVGNGNTCTETCNLIKKRSPEVPVIALTCNLNLLEKHSNGCFDDCVEKPFDIDTIINVVREYSSKS
mgnify:CR=1 FL=1